MCAADLDGDGDLDLVAALHDSNAISWWENTGPCGAVSCEDWTKRDIHPHLGGVNDVAVSDLDGDGDLDVIGAAESGDALAGGVLDRAGQALGWAIAQLTPCLNPEKIILSGPLAAVNNGFLARVKATAARVLRSSRLRLPEIVNSKMGEFGGALGAAALAVHRWQPAR